MLHYIFYIGEEVVDNRHCHFTVALFPPQANPLNVIRADQLLNYNLLFLFCCHEYKLSNFKENIPFDFHVPVGHQLRLIRTSIHTTNIICSFYNSQGNMICSSDNSHMIRQFLHNTIFSKRLVSLQISQVIFWHSNCLVLKGHSGGEHWFLFCFVLVWMEEDTGFFLVMQTI